MNETNPLILLRGPLIVLSVVSALAAPFVAQLATETLGLLLLLFLGLGVTLWDVVSCVSEQSKSYLNRQIENFVLDDVLKAIFDPEVGLIATCTASFVGSSAMYTLASNSDQRVRLLQSGLRVRDPNIARTVLYQPGGIKLLLPAFILEWLEASASSGVTVTSAAVAALSSSPKDCKVVVENISDEEDDEDDEDDDDESVTALYEREKRNMRHGTCQLQSQSNQHLYSAAKPRSTSTTAGTNREAPLGNNSPTDPPLPHEVVGAILVEKARERLSAMWDKVRPKQSDRTTWAMTTSTAALLLVLQMKTSQRAREILVGALQSLTTVGLSSITVACGAIVCASFWDEGKLSLSVVKDKVVGNLKRNWKGWLATLFLLYMRQRQSLRRRR